MAKKKKKKYYPSGRVLWFCTNIYDLFGNVILTLDDARRIIEEHRSVLEHFGLVLHDKDVYDEEGIADREARRKAIYNDLYANECEKRGWLKDENTGLYPIDQELVNQCDLTVNRYLPVKNVGEKKGLHLHCLLRFRVNRQIDEIGRWFGIPAYLIEIPKGRGAYEDCMDYLIHRKQKNKYQYDPEIVISDVDYPLWLDNRIVKEELHEKYHISREDMNDILNDVAINGLTLQKAEEMVSTPIFLRNQKLFREARNKYIYEHIPMPTPRMVFYIDSDGKSGAGKSVLTRAFCKQLARDNYGADITRSMDELKEYIYKAGKKGVAFQRYDGQPIIYIDDRNAGSMLKEFGGHEGVKNLLDLFPEKDSENIKYGDTIITAKYIVINGIQPFSEFLSGLNGSYKTRSGDMILSDSDVTQYARRFTGIIRIDMDTIIMLFNKGIMTDTDEYRDFVAICARKANFVNLIHKLSGNAQVAVETKILSPMLKTIKEIDERQNGKISEINEIPDEFKDYGKDIELYDADITICDNNTEKTKEGE